MPKLHLVYNYIDDYSDLTIPFIVGLVLALFVFATLSYYFKKENLITRLFELVWGDKAWNNTLFGSFFIGGIFFLIGGLIIPNFLNLRKVYTSHQLTFIAGKVTDFGPMPYGGHAPEYFKVKNVPFQFSNYETGIGGYHNAAAYGGVFKEGLYVKIGYYPTSDRNLILWLETE
ncbi:hypothetical protein ACEN9X_12005 [Mucilaginibacter sp. Mucisp86]|uniref:hypothetical protein n=1 Tax=Mucilaginibacter sp. Mucisp86 TaxID=3243060 RepID=UPI0039B43784